MRRFPLLALLALVALAAGFVLTTIGQLPEHAATHFDGRGVPNGWMTRTGYALFMLVFTVGLPLLMAAMVGWLPRLLPDLTNIPNRQYWMAPERREQTLAVLASHACWLGCLMTVMAAAVHWAILDAHAGGAPHLSNAVIVPILLGFAAALGIWIACLVRAFRRPA
jgi:uncharacterized membrane protein